MLEDFRVVSKRYVPIWRQQRSKKRVAAEYTMVLASAAALILVWMPFDGQEGLVTAISVQLAEGSIAAAALFLFMALVLGLMAQRLWRADRKASSALMLAEIAALALLAMTNPNSIDHLLVFAAVALSSAGWLVVSAFGLGDRLLHLAAALGIFSISLIPVSIGMGERALISTCVLGMDLMFFRHFD